MQRPHPISSARLAHAWQLPRRHPSTARHGCTASHLAWKPQRPIPPAGPGRGLGSSARPTPRETHQTRPHGEGRGAPHPAGPEGRRRALLMLCVEGASTRNPKVRKKNSAQISPCPARRSGDPGQVPNEGSAPPSAHALVTAGPDPGPGKRERNLYLILSFSALWSSSFLSST